MSKKITYFIQGFSPHNEAVSKEVDLLYNHFKKFYSLKIHNLALKNPLNFVSKKNFISYHYSFFPFFVPKIIRLNRQSNLSHIFTSLGDRLYLPLLRKNPLILTGAASTIKNKIIKQSRFYNNINALVVENPVERNILFSLGIDDNKIHFVRPGIDMKQFTVTPPPEKFTVLFATSPPKNNKFEVRGVNLLLKAAEQLKDVDFLFVWRGVGYNKIRKLIKKYQLKNVKVINKTILNMNAIFSLVSCTIAPFTCYDNFNKLIPRSIIESLAAGKPILISDKIAITDVVMKKKCGLVFTPNLLDLIKAITKIKQNYQKYQTSTRDTAEKYFSKETFVKEYQKIYRRFL